MAGDDELLADLQAQEQALASRRRAAWAPWIAYPAILLGPPVAAIVACAGLWKAAAVLLVAAIATFVLTLAYVTRVRSRLHRSNSRVNRHLDDFVDDLSSGR